MSKFLLSIIFFFTFTFSVHAKQPPAIATGGGSLNIIFLVDTSGSMYNKYNQVQDAIKTIIEDKSLAAQANFAMLTWGSESCDFNGSTQNTNCKLQQIQVPQYTPQQFCTTYYQYQLQQTSSGYYWVLVPVQSCYTQNVFTGYTYEYRDRYTWVPLSTDKVKNYNDMIQGISKINADGGGTYIDPPMLFVKSYLQSSEFQQIVSACDETIIIVMSDGVWYQYDAYQYAGELLNANPSIKTFSVAIGTDPTASTFQTMAQAGGTVNPYGGYAVDANSLAATFMALIQSVNFSTFSTVAPTILPETSAGDLILIPEFEYYSTRQWHGYLKAFGINTDGSVGAQKWELASNLNNIDPDSRKIWTALAGINSPTRTNRMRNPDNFLWNDTNTMNLFATAMETVGFYGNTPTEDAVNLTKFIRGYDVFDTDLNPGTTQRWKLNDIYNSKPIYVANPIDISTDPRFAGADKYFYDLDRLNYENFKSKLRKPTIYAGANSGLVHAIDADTGQELWAFMPPPLLSKMKNIMTAVQNNTNSIYGVDGALVAKDIFIDGEWRTYLIISYGYGARGFSVLDITEPEYPAHLLSIENYQDANGVRSIRKWDGDGNVTTISGYEKLGFTTSAPVITFMKDANSYQPVMVIGAGSSNNGVTSVGGEVGSAVYVVSLQAGTIGNIIDTKDLTDQDAPGGATLDKQVALNASNVYTIELSGNGTLGISAGASVSGSNVPANSLVVSMTDKSVTLNNQVSQVTQGATLTFTNRVLNESKTQIEVLESGSTPYMNGKYGFRLIVPNNNGIITSFDDTGADITSLQFNSTAERVINVMGSFTSDEMIQQPINITSLVKDPKDHINILFGTGDMENLSAFNKQPENKIISIQNNEADFFSSNKSRKLAWQNLKSSFNYYNSNLDWLAFVKEDQTFFNSTNASAGSCKNDDQEGWYVNINDVQAYDANGGIFSCRNGKLSTNISSYAGVSTFGVYIPSNNSIGQQCSVGNSVLIFRDTKCGVETVPSVYLPYTIIGGITAYKDSVYISISGKQNNQTLDASGKFQQTGSIVSGKPGFDLSKTKRLQIRSHIRAY
jgi:hypothetical protein